MPQDTHYGDEDPEFEEHEGDPEFEEELFQIAQAQGVNPEDMRGDSAFAARYAAWLGQQK